jgi:hypothetical protein
MNHISTKKEVVPIYGQYGEVLSEVTRKVKSDLLNLPHHKSSPNLIQKKPEFEPDTLHIGHI